MPPADAERVRAWIAREATPPPVSAENQENQLAERQRAPTGSPRDVSGDVFAAPARVW
jgi:hypothetical protein